jgi:hypothetical protein
MNRLCLSSLLALALVGCTNFKDDVATICDAPDKIGDTSKMKPSEKLEKMSAYLDDNVKSPTGREFLQALASTGRGGRNKMIRVQAAKYGINPCHMADQP